MTFFSVIFAPEPDAGPTVERALVRSILSSLVFEGATAVTLIEGMHKFTVRRIQHQNVTQVLVDAVFPDEDGELTAYRLVSSNRRSTERLRSEDGRQSRSHHLIGLGQALDLGTAALTAKTIHDLPLSGTLRFRRGDDDTLVPPLRKRPAAGPRT